MSLLPVAGGRCGQAAWISTAVLVVALVAGVAAPEGGGGVAVVVVSLVLFAIGIATFGWAFAVAVARSRTEVLAVSNAFLLQGSAPAAVRRSFYAALAVQTVVAVTAAAVRPFTAVAFGILAPMSVLGFMALWGVRHGEFDPR